jgi:uncharacterized protein (TIGR02466 family)
MPRSETLFVTRICRGRFPGRSGRELNGQLKAASLAIAADDRAGRAWCQKHNYPGYTSYASLVGLWREPTFAALAAALAPHVTNFARELDLDLGRRRLEMDSLWVNMLENGGSHSSHIHPLCVISGTYYVAIPPQAGAIWFEDPRLPLMMASPPRKPSAQRSNLSFVSVMPGPGTFLLWESWLRHEVPASRARGRRISVSFNYRWSEEPAGTAKHLGT